MRFIKLSANVIDSHLANILNKDIDLSSYLENAEIVNVRNYKRCKHCNCKLFLHKR